MSGIHPADSTIYGHLWSTEETRALLGDRGRTQAWLEIIAALAAAQAGMGIVPARAAEEIAAARSEPVDLDAVGERTRATGHSTLGLIQVLRERLGPDGREWLYHGATVQDVTDTWTGVVMQRVLAIARRDLTTIERALLELTAEHRRTVMLGRTHGQPGLPITFGLKAALWAAEARRHLDRLDEAEPRLAVGQLAGGVGSMSAFGPDGLELQRRFVQRLGLGEPDAPWTNARDRIAEFVTLLAQITGTLAKIGNEIYNLQRPEIGELAEPVRAGSIGSIAMPQKRNPGRSEHLTTLARIVRAAAGLALEGVIGEHERDGAAWKAEWAVVPEASAAAATALAIAAELIGGLQVDAGRMRSNVDAQRGYVLAEPVMLALVERMGRRRADELVRRAAERGLADGLSLRAALAADPEIELADEQLDALLAPEAALGGIDAIIDAVLDRARSRA